MPNPGGYSDAQWLRLRGEVVIKCVAVGGYTMVDYGAYVWAQDEERSLFDTALPDTLRPGDYNTAYRMVTDTTYELAQRIEAGFFELVSLVPSDPSVMMERPEA